MRTIVHLRHEPTIASSVAEALEHTATVAGQIDAIVNEAVAEVLAVETAPEALALARRLARSAAEIAIERGCDHPELARMRAAAELAKLVCEVLIRTEAHALIGEVDAYLGSTYRASG